MRTDFCIRCAFDISELDSQDGLCERCKRLQRDAPISCKLGLHMWYRLWDWHWKKCDVCGQRRVDKSHLEWKKRNTVGWRRIMEEEKLKKLERDV